MENEKVLNEENVETKNEQSTLNIDKLSDKERKKMLKSLLEENEKLIKENEKLIEENAKFKDSWYRTAADFENFKKRNQDTRLNAYKDGKSDIISKILVVGDSLDRALTMNLDDKTKEGIELIARGFLEVLESEGVSVINPVGEDFNPQTQEAIMQVPKQDGEEEGKVKQVFQKGYKLGEKIIRYAKVVVIGN